SYDNNGNTYNSNLTAYDVENRVSGVGWNNGAPAVDYSYDGQNKRIFMWTAGTLDSFNNVYNYSVVAYSPSGQKLGTYLFAPAQPDFQPGGINTPYITVSLVSSDQYFGGRRLAAMDQLGSAGTYYPWGEAKGGTNPQDTWSYATYWRDSATGLDYANNRYYSNVYGRFMTPDPYTNSGRLSDPQSWNRYAYTRGDPVNRLDPSGTDDISAPYTCFVGPEGQEQEQVECFDVTVPIPAAGSGSSYQAAAANVALFLGSNGAAMQIWNTWNRMTLAIQAAIA